MENKTKKIALVLGMFLFAISLSACGKKEESTSGAGGSLQENQRPGAQKNKGPMTEDVRPEDTIEFSDPGDDEIGKEIKEIDDLLNQTSPSEYDETDLSESAIEDEVELK